MLRSGASCSDGRTQPQRSRVDRLHAKCRASASRTAVGTGAVAAGIPSADLVRHRLPGHQHDQGLPVRSRSAGRSAGFRCRLRPIRSRASMTPGASSSSERYRTVLFRMCRLDCSIAWSGLTDPARSCLTPSQFRLLVTLREGVIRKLGHQPPSGRGIARPSSGIVLARHHGRRQRLPALSPPIRSRSNATAADSDSIQVSPARVQQRRHLQGPGSLSGTLCKEMGASHQGQCARMPVAIREGGGRRRVVSDRTPRAAWE